jgi:hypothetical protein
MRIFLLLAAGLALCGQAGCGSRKVAEPEPLDDGAFVPVLPEDDEFRRDPRGGEPQPAPGGTGFADSSEVNRSAGDQSLERRARRALEEAKIYYLRGEFGFAVEALREIGRESQYYPQAQLLLRQLQ